MLSPIESPVPPGIDPGILPVVRLLYRNGIHTFQSCEGGAGHCTPEPFVQFHGNVAEAFHAAAVVLFDPSHGLRPYALSQEWALYHGWPDGPVWRLSFFGRQVSSRDKEVREVVCPACHHPDHDPGSCPECPRCELHYDEARSWLDSRAPSRDMGIDHEAEKAALDAGTHVPAVDDFGNQYLSPTSRDSDTDLLERLSDHIGGFHGECHCLRLLGERLGDDS